VTATRDRPAISRRDLVELALACGIVPMLGAPGWAQSAPEIDVLMTNALVGPGLREIVEREAKVKIKDAPFRTVTDSLSRLLAPGGTKSFSLMHAQVAVVRDPVLGAHPGDEKIAPLDLSKIPNAAHIAATFSENYIRRDGKTYALPGTFGFDTVIFNAAEVPENDPYTQSWGMLFEDKYAARIAWFDSALHMFLCAGLYLGNPAPETMTGADLDTVGKFLISKKKNVRTFWTSFAQGANLIGSGEVVCAYGPVVMRAGLAQRKFPVGSAWCREGVLSLVSGGFIPKDAPHQELAHAVINAMIGPEYAKHLTRVAGYLSCSNDGASGMSPDEAKRAGYGILDGSVKHHGIKQPANFNAWVEAWSRVKSA
jgi:spermidine/putrescine transport system substrate-binding protein